MPVCSHCGKEVSEGIKFCPECGERLKKEFTPEEKEKYIQELEASVKEEKPAEKPKTIKKKLAGGIAVLIIAVIIIIAAVAICTPTETHYSIAEIKTQGWPADKVSIDVARISPFGGGVSYSETHKQYAFFVYDKTAIYTGGTAYEDIVVVVKESNINFVPKESDFIKLTGKLQSSDTGTPREGWRYDKKAMIIYAINIERTTPPADWRE